MSVTTFWVMNLISGHLVYWGRSNSVGVLSEQSHLLCSSIQFSSFQFSSVQFNSIHFTSIQFNSSNINPLFNPTSYTCDSGHVEHDQRDNIMANYWVKSQYCWSHLETGQTYNTSQVLATYLVCILLCILSRLSVDCDKGQQHIVFDQDRSNPCKDHGTDISHTHQDPQTIPHHKDTSTVHSREAVWHLSSPGFSGAASTSISLAVKYCISLNTNHYNKFYFLWVRK
jgi:hypothetical protein